MAVGKPIVTTNYFEFENNKDLLYLAKDPKSFALAIETAYQEQKNLTALRQKSIESMSWEKQAEKTNLI
jgi:hypothetical protein